MGKKPPFATLSQGCYNLINTPLPTNQVITVQLYNTLSGRIEPFEPRGGHVGIYVCGITPYDTTHIGHAFTYVVFDVLVRYLRYRGYQVRYVQNVTDIDDDILRRAAQVGIPWDELARIETARYVQDMAELNVLPPDVFPWATQEIATMIEIIQALLARGYAYESGGSVYYAVRADPAYGQLCKLDYAEMLRTANERGNYPDDPNKRDPLDFVLWQAAKPGEPTWDSPWGPGRPGWHIECSAMSMRYLGPTVDIHGGGADLIFPHHESEIAQSEHYTGVKPFVRIWMHTGMVRLGNEKMSKSLGNLVMVHDVLKRYSADALRLYLLSFPYRTSWAYTEEGVAQGEELAQQLREAAQGDGYPDGPELDPGPWRERFLAAMDNDLNTPQAIAALRDLASAIREAQAQGSHTGNARAALRELAGVLGLTLTSRS